MKIGLGIENSSKKLRIILVVGGCFVNVLLFFITNRLKLPLFLDTIGTITVAGIAGVFPGILTAIISNTICAFFDSNSFFFMFVNVLLAIYAAWYFHRYSTNRIDRVLVFALSAGLISGLLGAHVQLELFGNGQNQVVLEMSAPISYALNIPIPVSFTMGNVLINILDKFVTTLIAFLVIRFTPQNEIDEIRNAGWKQKPPTVEDLKKVREWGKDVKLSARLRMTITLVGTSLILVFIMGWIGVSLYFETEKNARTETATSATKFATEVIDVHKVPQYLEELRDANGYEKTETMLEKIRENARGVDKLYVVSIEEGGFRYIFYSDEEGAYKSILPGSFIPFGEEVEPYLDKLYSGVRIDPIESGNLFGWVLKVYYPLGGVPNLNCFIVAEVSLTYMADYMKNFILKVIIILAGFFVLFVAYALWNTDIYSTFPISSMAEVMDGFSTEDADQEQLDENVRKIRSLDIHTGDEVEKLYDSICQMTLSQAEQMRSIRRLSESTARMQDGLIITMADMVENREQDLGAHVQKTSAYVRIVVEGLKKKGYYPEKLTPKFMSDVVRSAPLYDVGRIKIPEEIFNKPGKLTPQEHEIVKKHTIYGKEIMENAISTVSGENYLKEARNMAAYHHEHWDGSGYPEGLHGEVIPLSARIMAIADVFDALTSKRVYKDAYSLEESLQIMQERAGTRFDPKCVEVFLEAVPEIKVILRKYNNMDV